MDRRERRLRIGFGIFLLLVTVATRLAFRSHTLFEFDSINFVVGLFRFNLAQVTPQMPGYILHVLLGRLLYALVGNPNQAYVWLSMLLSVGSVLFLWRAAFVLRGERVGVIAALLWLTMPLFWFHGEVNAIYAEEAFYTSLLLYLGGKWLRSADPAWEPILYLLALSLATGARQTSILFFLPATIFLFLKRRPSARIVLSAIAVFVIASAMWLGELLREADGLSHYLALAAVERNFKTQSVLFGNSWQSQFDLIGKVIFYCVVAIGPIWLLVLTLVLTFAKRSLAFVREYTRNNIAQFVFLLAAMPLAFYLIVFFMKAGYLLNVLPSVILTGAVLLDQEAIWIAEHQKRRNPTVLTRRLITRNVTVLTSAFVILNVAWFLVPWPGTEQRIYNNEDTRNSFIHGAVNRYEHSQSPALTLANRAFEYTNVSGIRAVDSLNDETLRALRANGGNDSGTVILASWWYRWCYELLPNAITYDLELNPQHLDSLWVGRSQHWYRSFLDAPGDSIIRFHSTHPVLLLLRHDRPDFEEVTRQVHLEQLAMPEYLDLYRILDTTFVLQWHGRTFVGTVE